MGAPLILTKNRNSSPENSNPVAVEEQTQTEIPEHEEDKAVNGKLDISIKDNSIIVEKSTEHYAINPYQLNDFKHNYH